MRGTTATKSGINILPFMLMVVAGTMIAGAATGITGHYWTWMIIPPLIFSCVGGGLFRLVTAQTSSAMLSGFQVLLGFGIGCALQQSLVAIQAEYHATPNKIPQATAIISFAQLMGGVIGIAIAQVLFTNGLTRELAPYGLPSEQITYIKQSVEAIKELSEPLKTDVINAYVYALRDVYVMAVPAAALSVVCALFVRNLNTKKMGISAGAVA